MLTRFIDRHQRWLFPAPAVIFVLLMMIFPLGFTLWNSFSGWSLTAGRPNTFIGPQNYFAILADARFWNAVWNTLYFTALAMSVELVLGVAIALLLDAKDYRGTAAATAASRDVKHLPDIDGGAVQAVGLHDGLHRRPVVAGKPGERVAGNHGVIDAAGLRCASSSGRWRRRHDPWQQQPDQHGAEHDQDAHAARVPFKVEKFHGWPSPSSTLTDGQDEKHD